MSSEQLPAYPVNKTIQTTTGGIFINYYENNRGEAFRQHGAGNAGDIADAYHGHARTALAMAYIIPQPGIKNVYKPEDALRRGTLFPELDKPFTAHRGAL